MDFSLILLEKKNYLTLATVTEWHVQKHLISVTMVPVGTPKKAAAAKHLLFGPVHIVWPPFLT